MRPSFLARLGLAVCSTVALCLLSATAEAAARPRSLTGSVCSAQPALHAAKPAAKSGSRTRRIKTAPPVPTRRYLVRAHRLVQHHPGLWLERSRAALLPENDAAALQDRTAVVTGEDDLLRLASLEPLGVLWFPQSPVTVSGVTVRRAPRGPPFPDRA